MRQDLPLVVAVVGGLQQQVGLGVDERIQVEQPTVRVQDRAVVSDADDLPRVVDVVAQGVPRVWIEVGDRGPVVEEGIFEQVLLGRKYASNGTLIASTAPPPGQRRPAQQLISARGDLVERPKLIRYVPSSTSSQAAS
jgi:hypothetical protein